MNQQGEKRRDSCSGGRVLHPPPCMVLAKNNQEGPGACEYQGQRLLPGRGPVRGLLCSSAGALF